jgi:hypothetical protein
VWRRDAVRSAVAVRGIATGEVAVPTGPPRLGSGGQVGPSEEV